MGREGNGEGGNVGRKGMRRKGHAWGGKEGEEEIGEEGDGEIFLILLPGFATKFVLTIQQIEPPTTKEYVLGDNIHEPINHYDTQIEHQEQNIVHTF